MDTVIPELAVQAAAEVLLADYATQYSADHLTWRDFEDLAKTTLTAARPHLNDLSDRLAAAEQVCVLLGWTAYRIGNSEEKALHELWRYWTNLPGVDASPDAHPELSPERIAVLAAKRDATRARTLDILAGEITP